jgi:N-acetylglucosamine-6-phosphate deacetylase
VTTTAWVPARIAGKPELGTIEPGSAADLVVLDDSLEIVRVLVAGEDVVD